MIQRHQHLQRFVEAAAESFDRCATDPASRHSLAKIFSALKTAAGPTAGPAGRLPVCAHLDAALDLHTTDRSLLDLAAAFRALEPMLQWRRRSADASASDNFAEGHANVLIFGPGGLEDRRDVWLGATLMAPQVRYPDHDHAPEETYLVLSEGEFWHGSGSWFAPGLGGSFYNPPGIRHAMRSGDRPLFAFWALLAGNAS